MTLGKILIIQASNKVITFSPGSFEKDSEPVEEFNRHIETTETFESIHKEQFLDAIGKLDQVHTVQL